jgi:hypothetical protein
MDLRIVGTPEEVQTTVAALRAAQQLAVVRISDPYPTRGESRQSRVYVTALMRQDHREVRP